MKPEGAERMGSGGSRLALALAALHATAATAKPPPPPPPATPVKLATPSGDLLGSRRGNVESFLGVPFAQPPVGALRWRPPTAAHPWNGTRNASEFGARCVQMGTPFASEPCVDYAQLTDYMGLDGAGPGERQSEDCLYLNVYKPAHAAPPPGPPKEHVCTDGPNCTTCVACCHSYIAPGRDCEQCVHQNCHLDEPQQKTEAPALLPVLFWVHGGSYESGAGYDFDGSSIIEFSPNVLVVTVNYRLNVFGFLGSEQLRSLRGSDGSTGNYGLQDQRLAMAWVQTHIKSFGGGE